MSTQVQRLNDCILITKLQHVISVRHILYFNSEIMYAMYERSECFQCMQDQNSSTFSLLLSLLLLLLKKIGNARPGEGDCHPISPKTPAPHYPPIEEKKRKGK